MNVKQELERVFGALERVQFNDLEIDPLKVQAVMLNEAAPADPAQDFYGGSGADYLSTTIPLFQKAGLEVNRIQEILELGVYLTNVVKTPKSAYAIEKSCFENSLPFLEKELELFPNVKVILLMGDVAKKAFNRIAKKATGKNVIPSAATYKLRNSEFYYGTIRVIPSYIMTGGNILIEKSKFAMAAEDIAAMAKIIR